MLHFTAMLGSSMFFLCSLKPERISWSECMVTERSLHNTFRASKSCCTYFKFVVYTYWYSRLCNTFLPIIFCWLTMYPLKFSYAPWLRNLAIDYKASLWNCVMSRMLCLGNIVRQKYIREISQDLNVSCSTFTCHLFVYISVSPVIFGHNTGLHKYIFEVYLHVVMFG